MINTHDKRGPTDASVHPDGSDNSSLAGSVVRTALRYIRYIFRSIRRVKPEFQLRLPKELPKFKLRFPEEFPKLEFRLPKRFLEMEFRLRTPSVSKSAEQLRSAMELRENYLETRRDDRPPSGSSAPEARRAGERRSWRGLAWDGLRAVPGFLRSALLTTMVFSIYEEGITVVKKTYEHSKPILFLAPTTIGMAGGFCHGLLYTLSDISYRRLFRTMNSNTQFGTWTALSHSLVYGSLFGSYEGFKYVLVAASNTSTRHSFGGATCVTLAGMASGYISEVVAHFSKHIEPGRLRDGIEIARMQKLPATRACAPGMVMSTLGFLAFEYAQDIEHTYSSVVDPHRCPISNN